jgi:2-polyprenyl-3-methyl-5-hydroxy-6-metoxy-1,4-benzoquinol methylase
MHEVPDQSRFLGEIFSMLKPCGLLLLAEPNILVSSKDFAESVRPAKAAGLLEVSRPGIFISHTVL